MIQLKKKDFNTIVQKMKRKFEVREGHTGDWQVRIFYKNKFIVRTKCSEGGGDIFPNIVKQIQKQLHFSNDEELKQFIDCSLSCNQYLSLLQERDVI